MSNVIEKIDYNKLLNIDKPIVVAVSTGVDSMVLLDILLRLEYKCVIAHVNHNKRKQSITEYDFISKYAVDKKIPFEGFNFESNEANFQHEAHNKRMNFFQKIADKYNTDQIAFAHHLDDQIETILMRIVRGSSFSGYSGIKERYTENGYTYIRPFLKLSKNDILDYVSSYNIHYFDDESNQTDDYTRNRFRHNIIPLIEKENPNYRAKFEQFSEMISLAYDVIEEQTNSFFNNSNSDEHISIELFNKQNQLVQIEILKQLINKKTSNNLEIAYSQYLQMINLCKIETPNQTLQLSGDYLFIKSYDKFEINKIYDNQEIFIEINDFGDYRIKDNLHYIVSPVKISQNNSNYFQLCYNKLVFPLYLRFRRNGDKINLNIGTKKVKDVLIDQKIPMQVRNSLILLANRDSVLWIPGIKKAYQKECAKSENKLYIYEVK